MNFRFVGGKKRSKSDEKGVKCMVSKIEEKMDEMEDILADEDESEIIPLTEKEFRDKVILSIRSIWRAIYFVVILIVVSALIINWRLNVNIQRFHADLYNQTEIIAGVFNQTKIVTAGVLG